MKEALFQHIISIFALAKKKYNHILYDMEITVKKKIPNN